MLVKGLLSLTYVKVSYMKLYVILLKFISRPSNIISPISNVTNSY